MAIVIKTPDEIRKMRAAGAIVASILDQAEAFVRPGVSTADIDELCHKAILATGSIPAPLNYCPSGSEHPYPCATCISVNNQVCHGIPSKEKILRNGDIVNIDITVIKDGYHGDSSRMYYAGMPSIAARRLCEVTRECLEAGIGKATPGARLGDVGCAIQRHAERNGFSVVREFCGHGIGKKFHEEPQVLHFGKPGAGLELVPGMTFTIEPMINQGKSDVQVLRDKWTVVTKDRKLSAQWEHTIAITESGSEVLTMSTGASRAATA